MAEFPSQEMLDRAIDFSLGLLNPEEEKALLAAASQDPDLEVMIREQCKIHEQGRIEGTPSAENRAANQAPVSRPTVFQRPRTLMLGSALAATLALFFLFKPQPEPALFWLPVDEVRNIQRSGGSGADAWRRGVEFYAAGDLEGAIDTLQEANVQGPLLDMRNLYLASALINADRLAEARRVLGEIDLDSLPYPWRERGYELQKLGLGEASEKGD